MIYQALILALLLPAAWATKTIPEILELIPNENLMTQQTTSCEAILRRMTIRDGEKQAKELSRSQLEPMLEYLFTRRFHLTSATLTKESASIRNILAENFENPPNGIQIYRFLQERQISLKEVLAPLPEVVNFQSERNDSDYKRWSIDVLIKIAQEVESFGLPFEKSFLMKNSSLVGMKLAEIYGYPVRGDSIVYRTENKLGLDLEEVRKLAQLPPISPHRQRLDLINNTELSEDLTLKVLRFLQNEHGLELIASHFFERSYELSDIIFNEFQIQISASQLDEAVTHLFGGWKPLKENHFGVTYEGRSMYVPGRPDWSSQFIIEVLQLIHSFKGIEPSFTLLHVKENFKPYKELIQQATGFSIRGKTLYERATLSFGSFKQACLAANVPYYEYGEKFVSSLFLEEKPKYGTKDLNPALLMELLHFIDAMGFEPVEPFLKDDLSFSQVAPSIEETFGFQILGDEILSASKKYFGAHSNALRLGQVAYYDSSFEDFNEDPPEMLVRALKIIIQQIPNLTGHKLRNEYSSQVEEILKKEMNFKISGYNLSNWARAWGNALSDNYGGVQNRGYPRMIQYTNNQGDWPRNLNIQRLSEDYPSKDLTLKMIQTLASAGIYPTIAIREQVELRARAVDVLEGFLGYRISINSFFTIIRHHFGNIATARKIVGLPYNDPGERIDDEELLTMLKIVWAHDPGIPPRHFNSEKSAIIGKLLKRKLGVQMSGTTLKKLSTERFGSVASGLRLAGVTLPWSRSYPPSEKQLIDMIAFLIHHEFPLSQRTLRTQEIFKDANDLIENNYGFRIDGMTIFNSSKKYFGSNGGWAIALNKAQELLNNRIQAQ